MSRNYWKDRNIESQANITDKTIEEIETQLKKMYKAAMETTIADFKDTSLHIINSLIYREQITPADLYKLDKYWHTQNELKKTLQKLGDKQIELFQKKFIKEFYEIYRALALKDDLGFREVDEIAAKQIINSIWCADGKAWSDRVWGNTNRLQQALNDTLFDCVIRGKTPEELKGLLMKDFSVDYHRATTLVNTELAHIQTEAARKRYEDLGIKKVQIWADYDERRCKHCGQLHKKVYSIYEHIPLPAHPNCRCCIVPVREKKKSLEG